MPALGCVRADDHDFPPEPQACLRCGREAPMRFAGPCPECCARLRDELQGEARSVEGAEYVPKMNVTPNAVALKDD
ncbi:MAG: hypothetical protein ACKOBG_00910 [Actinomycetota bacterium]